MKTIVAIHQPNFFPWLGYFDKIARSDVFVLLDNVYFPKTGGTWGNRVKLIVSGKEQWITIPIVRSYHGQRRINEMKINNSLDWRARILKTIQLNYGSFPYFKEVIPIVETLINNPTDNLADFNITAIRTLARKLGILTDKFILGSALKIDNGGNNLLIEITKAVGGTTYMCGGGAEGYQDDVLIETSGLNLVYQDFEHPIYIQKHSKTFIPGLSIIDALFNLGMEGVACLVLDKQYETSATTKQ